MSVNKPSILLINRVYPPERGATGRLMQNLAHGLQQSGWKVSVLTTQSSTTKGKKGKVQKYFVKGAKKYKTPLGGFTNLWRLWRMGLRIPRHDIVLTMTDPPMLVCIGNRIAKSKKSKHVHWAQDIYPDLLPRFGYKLPQFFYNFLHKKSVRAMNNVHQVVAIGRCMESYLKHHGVTAGTLTTIPNWTDFEMLAPSSPEGILNLDVPLGIAKRPEEMFRDDSPKFRVLYAGQIGKAHTMRAVVEAAQILSVHQEIEFVFVGDHESQSYVAQERARRGLENIKFLPYQPIEKFRDVMESGDVHLVTMRQSVKGMVMPCKFYSGLTVGRPTMYVGPKGTEIDHVITEYQAGVTISPDDPQGLADAIYAYRSNGDIWFETQEGALRASQDFHPNHSINKWITLLKKIRVS
jgi:glycosyltransferase involved in cell wall biosynthesis